MSESKKLTKHDITMLGIRSSFLQASFNYERMQACGFLWSMLPVLKKIHGDDKEALSLAMTDNLEFINTHPNLVGFLMGLMMSLEEGGADHDTIKGLKLALFGPIAVSGMRFSGLQFYQSLPESLVHLLLKDQFLDQSFSS